MSPLTLTKAWLWISALASVAGWVLSGLGQLNGGGYLVFAVASAGLLGWLLRERAGVAAPPEGRAPARLLGEGESAGQEGSRSSPLRRGARDRGSGGGYWTRGRLRRRFGRWLPAIFLVFAGLILLGGILYAPTNYAGLTYRTPRVLHWLSEEGWFWIHTASPRLNTRAAGFEWLTAPLLLFTRSDRLFFLLNFVPFLLLPGLVFGVCRGLGVAGRVAWWWMWILPTGYNFLLQAGSIANDTFPAVYALAAVYFGLRAWRSRAVADLWHSALAASLLTGAKASNLPLLLPWALLVVPLAGLWLRRPVRGLAVTAVAVAASFLVTAALNVKYCGDWSGLNLERLGMEMKEPLVGLWGNAFLLVLNNFVPPVFPLAGWWNASAPSLLPAALLEPMLRNFELGFLTLWELPGEDWVGIGFGVSCLVVLSVAAACWRGGRSLGLGSGGPLPAGLRWAVVLAPWVALLVYCVKSGMVTPARLISPYYPLLLPLVLLGAGPSALVRRKLWRWAVGLHLAIALPVLVVTPARPLWPAQTVFGALAEHKPEWRLAQRGRTVYQVYAQRSDPLARVREAFPPGLTVVGFLGDGDDLDISFWRPFFARKVRHITLQDSPEFIRARGISYAAVGGAYLRYQGVSLSEWLARVNAEVVAERTGLLKVSEGPQPWYVVRFRQAPPDP